jgi:hypothetical protein
VYRAFLLGINGEYNYQPCSSAAHSFSFTGITAEQLKDFVATVWVEQHVVKRPLIEIIRWNNELHDRRLSEMDEHAQEYWEEYIEANLTPNKSVFNARQTRDRAKDRTCFRLQQR